ncbi:DUF397 domain-containing protein [Streptomyces albireticuli]|uniref:DUF397 domain-containing protein n=1 Tax=Streptomyces albireticuli TaxID=1940 RepID=UPI0036AEDFE9
MGPWQRSSYSGGMDNQECVELSCVDGVIRLREGDEPGAVIATTPGKLAALIRAVKAGGGIG